MDIGPQTDRKQLPRFNLRLARIKGSGKSSEAKLSAMRFLILVHYLMCLSAQPPTIHVCILANNLEYS